MFTICQNLEENQVVLHCITSQPHIESSEISFSDPDTDCGDGDWIDADSAFDMPFNDLSEEASGSTRDLLTDQSNHAPFHSEQQKCFANLLNCSPLGPDGSFSPSKPSLPPSMIEFMPKRIYSAADHMQHIYTEWLRGNQAWELQDTLPKGTTLLGVTLSSDKITSPRKGSTKSYLLLALLPVPKFVHPNKHLHGVLADWLLHQVISIVVKPLKWAAKSGHIMGDQLRNLKYCFTPFLVTLLTPLSNTLSHVSPAMLQPSLLLYPHNLEILFSVQLILHQKPINNLLWSKEKLVQQICLHQACQKQQLNGVSFTFWLDSALVEPSSFITLEPLHQFFKMFWDHDWNWCSSMLGADELNLQLSLLQVPKIMDTDITKLTASLQEFHDNKSALMEASMWGSLDHWQIPKLEIMLAIAPSISSMDALVQWSADITEHTHINIIKNPI
ncbi:hypothetical protein EDC04DRAFT_2617650 [Pisolithus marmoratus]|nr:hypothetical protein EDC04DRAFT_2617650 [Pisolithus marmoratus]